MPNFRELITLPTGLYGIDVGLMYIKETLSTYEKAYNLDKDPPFQRGYVWSDFQRQAYVEYFLSGGKSGRNIYFNCPNFQNVPDPLNKGGMTLVDGKQRISAVLGFLEGKVKPFGYAFSEFTDKPTPLYHSLRFNVNSLSDPLAVVDWYLAMNTGGSIHTKEDLQSAYNYKKSLKK